MFAIESNILFGEKELKEEHQVQTAFNISAIFESSFNFNSYENSRKWNFFAVPTVVTPLHCITFRFSTSNWMQKHCTCFCVFPFFILFTIGSTFSFQVLLHGTPTPTHTHWMLRSKMPTEALYRLKLNEKFMDFVENTIFPNTNTIPNLILVNLASLWFFHAREKWFCMLKLFQTIKFCKWPFLHRDLIWPKNPIHKVDNLNTFNPFSSLFDVLNRMLINYSMVIFRFQSFVREKKCVEVMNISIAFHAKR